MNYALYIDKSYGVINTVVTLQEVVDGDINVLFHRLPGTSGTVGFTGNTKSVVGKSPIPTGRFWLSTKPEKLNAEPYGTPFHIISSEQGKRTLVGDDGVIRTDIGLHYDNRFLGSSGCPTLLRDTITRKAMAEALMACLESLYNSGVRYVRTVVL